MPPVLTFAARVSDGLPLVASFSASHHVLEEHKKQSKEILRDGIGSSSVAKMSIETTHQKTFHYLMRDGVCYLTLTESSYPKRLSFLFLAEVATAFVGELTKEYGDQWRHEVETAARPYQFIKIDPVIQRKQRDFSDPSSKQNSSKLNEDLADIHSIMKRNIQEVLNRGEKLESVADTSRNLVDQSKKFKWGAKKLTFQAMLNQWAPVVGAGFFVVFIMYLKFFY